MEGKQKMLKPIKKKIIILIVLLSTFLLHYIGLNFDTNGIEHFEETHEIAYLNSLGVPSVFLDTMNASNIVKMYNALNNKNVGKGLLITEGLKYENNDFVYCNSMSERDITASIYIIPEYVHTVDADAQLERIMVLGNYMWLEDKGEILSRDKIIVNWKNRELVYEADSFWQIIHWQNRLYNTVKDYDMMERPSMAKQDGISWYCITEDKLFSLSKSITFSFCLFNLPDSDKNINNLEEIYNSYLSFEYIRES